MKLIKAYIRTYFAYDTIHALEKIGVPRVSVFNLEEVGEDTDQRQRRLSSELGSFIPMAKLELIVHDEKVDSVVDTILDSARSGEHGAKGDGIIAISPV